MSGTRSSSRLKALRERTPARQDTQGAATAHARSSTNARSRPNKKPAPNSRSARTSKSSVPEGDNAASRENVKKSAPRANKRRKVANPEPVPTVDDPDADVDDPDRITQGLTDMPLDILFEIFKLCNPVDILRLAQTCKALRGTLLLKSCKRIWEYTIKHYRTTVPPCHNGRLPLPQYINLLFTTNCFECGSDKGKYALWAFFERLCNKCIKSKYMVVDRKWAYYGVRIWYRLPGSKVRRDQLIANVHEAQRIREETKPIKDTNARHRRQDEIDHESRRCMAFARTIRDFVA
ncbi:uncharacterized protein SCHCODRAFT_01164936, partial [Schizophyllum commune H4-8]|uniref:uncharacterized protein n=1 Tax=Schizophyllum commune (strain H4-8 / FGSC 9210) TaxID=578458 RepID=UPI00215E7760